MSNKIRRLVENLKDADDQMDEIFAASLPQPYFHFNYYTSIIFDRAFTCLFISSKAARFLGLQPDDIVGKHRSDWVGLIAPPIFQPLYENFKKVVSTGKAVSYETAGPLLPAQGMYCYLECSLQPVCDDDGKVESVICSVRDVTERKLLQNTVTNQMAEFDQVVALCPMPILIVNKQGIVVNVNTLYANSVRLPREEIIGKHFGFISEHISIESDKTGIMKALAGIETHQEYLKFLDITWQVNAVPMRDQHEGEIIGAIGIYSDITKRDRYQEKNHKKQQELLNRYLSENQKLNQIIELCPFGIVLYDAQGYVTAMNKSGYERRIPNFRGEDFIGKPIKQLISALGEEWEHSVSQQALSGRDTRNRYFKTPQGTFMINAVPLRDCDNNITGAMTITHDITEYEKLKEEMAKIERLNSLGEMAAGVAHEIRNPLTVVKGYLQFLSGKVNESMAEQFGVALDELARIEQIISDFLSLAGNRLTENKILHLNNIVKGVFPLIQAEALKRGIELAVKTAEIPELLLNENDMKQLLLNLARNGMEAMNQHGTLAIETYAKDGMTCLSITDSGCGIPDELREMVFIPFFTTKSDGTGLGLAVCGEIVRRHHGTIEIQSEEGKGTRFVIKFQQGIANDVC